jgi:hypothetical protein
MNFDVIDLILFVATPILGGILVWLATGSEMKKALVRGGGGDARTFAGLEKAARIFGLVAVPIIEVVLLLLNFFTGTRLR